MKILFIGATGMLGRPVARQLINAGFELLLLARDKAKAQVLFPEAAIIKGNVFDTGSLLTAMKGMDAVYCNLSVLQTSKKKEKQPEREGIENILAAAKASGINRLVYLSSLVHRYQGMNGFNWWAFGIKAAAVQKIKASGIPYTIFYPSTFMECYPYQMMRGNKIGVLGKSEAPMWFIAAEDYSKQVAASFRLLTNENKEYAIQGPEAYIFSDANKIFISNYRKARLSLMKAPIGVFKFLGLFSPKFNYGWHICEALNKYPEKFESDAAWKELGKPEITLADFAKSL